MITFKFQDKDVKAPNSWEEVTVRHFINPYFLAGDSLSLLSALAGVDRKALANSKDDIMNDLNKMVKFMVKEPLGYQGAVPKSFKLRGKECKIPQDIELERLGQKIMLQDAMTKYKFVYEAIPDAIAIYMLPSLNDGEFDDDLVPELREEVLDLMLVDVFPVADFFLARCRSLAKSGSIF
jgi:hypothetical protein